MSKTETPAVIRDTSSGRGRRIGPSDHTAPTKGNTPMRKTLVAISLAASTLVSPVFADDIDTVRAFYADLLSTPAETTKERYFELFSPDVVSIPTPPAGPDAHGMLSTIAYIGQVLPDLKWEPLEIIETDDNRFVVRGRATGTPVGPFFGVAPATGKSFDIMSIDIVAVADGKIVHVCHLEDWTGAIAQLTAK